MDYYTEFAEVAPHDNSRYILKYKIYRARRSPLQDQIAILEEYKDREYTERWLTNWPGSTARPGISRNAWKPVTI